MNIDNLTIGEVKALQNIFMQTQKSESVFEVGKSYFIRMVTYHCVLKVAEIRDGFLVSEPNAYTWVASS